MTAPSRKLLGPGVAIVALTLIGFGFLSWQERRGSRVPVHPSALAKMRVVSLGSPDAPVTIAEFADFQCPACAWFENNEMGEVKERLISTGKARLLFFDFPLPRHPHAIDAARAARCAGEQGHFWGYHDALYSRQPEWSALENPSDMFVELAEPLVDDDSAFEECLNSRRFYREVENHVMLARSLGVPGTPTFFVDTVMVWDGASADEIERLVLNAVAARSAEQ